MILRFWLVIPLSVLFAIADRNFFSLSKYSRRAVPGLSGASSNITKYFCFFPLFLCSLCSVPCNSGCWRLTELHTSAIDAPSPDDDIALYAEWFIAWIRLLKILLCPLCPALGFVLDIVVCFLWGPWTQLWRKLQFTSDVVSSFGSAIFLK